MDCFWKISRDCHKTKKNSFVCNACWKEADEAKRDSYKELEGGWCTVFGCWKSEGKDTGFCAPHNKARLRSPRRRSTPPPTPPKLLTASSKGKAKPPSRLLEPLLKLRSEEITEVVREGVLELYRRTKQGD